MKKINYILTLLIVIVYKVSAQCPNNNILSFGAPSDVTPVSVGSTASNIQVWAGDFVTVNVINGGNYTFKTCVGNSYNTALTLYTDAGGLLKGYNDDFCSTQSQITWTADFTGTLRVLLDDMPGCLSGATNTTIDVTLNSLPCITPTLSVASFTNVACNGLSTGAAAVSATGGSSFTYTWSPSGGNSAIASGLTANIYTCTTTNNCGATTSKTIQITQPTTALSTSTAVGNVLCNGESNGSAAITATGGTTGYTYLWNTGATTSVITNQLAGVKTITITDANNCKVTNTVSITQPTTLNSSTSVTNVLCNGGTTGAATVSISGGTPSYTYLWSTGATTSKITNLNSGVTTVTVTDGNGCILSTSVMITQPSALNTSTSSADPLCFGGSSAGVITATGGVPSYTYLWSNGFTSPFFSVLNSGVYTCTVTDANGCTSIKPITVSTPTELNMLTIEQNPVCFGGTGSATISATGSTPPYTYLWSNSATTSIISGLIAGVYTATVTDANGCVGTKSINIISPSAITTTTGSTIALCFGGLGSASLTAFGGTAPYSYLWSTAATSSVVTNLVNGVYTTTVTDVKGCTNVSSVIIASPSAITTSTAATNVLCNGETTGTATVTTSGGTSPYTYLWSSAQTTSITTGLNSGIKTVTVTDANGCISTNTIIITEPSAITLNVSGNLLICSGTCITSTAVAIGGTGSYNYAWQPSGVTTQTSVLCPSGSNTYTVIATDANGCIKQVTKTISNLLLPNINITSSSSSICLGASITYTASGASTYTWSTASTNSIISVSPLSNTTYSVIGKGSNNCINTASISVTVNPIPIITMNSGAICSGQTFTLIPNGASTYTFSSGSSVVSPNSNTSYSVSGTDTNGCVSLIDAVSNVTVNALPTLSIATNNTLLCSGQTATLSAMGASSYTWSSNENTIDITISPTTTTTYTVIGTDINGCENNATIQQDVSLCTGIQLNTGDVNKIMIYPNPTNGSVNITSAEAITKITVKDVLGKAIDISPVVKNTTTCTLNIQHLPQGIYFITAWVNNNSQTYKLIKE